jgi:hypothetical protein
MLVRLLTEGEVVWVIAIAVIGALIVYTDWEGSEEQRRRAGIATFAAVAGPLWLLSVTQ